MSLDVTLTTPVTTATCPHCGGSGTANLPPSDVYDANITHNLGRMADAAGIYQACWRPEEIGVTKAGQLAPLLRVGLEALRADPERFRAFDAPNGWGTYDQFVPWVERYLAACEVHPDADVWVSR